MNFVHYFGTVSLLLANPGKLIQCFPKIQFRGHDSWDGFLGNSFRPFSIFSHGWVFQKSVFITPRNSLYIMFRLNALFWMSFPETGLWLSQCDTPQKSKIDDWMSFPVFHKNVDEFSMNRLDEFSMNQSSSCQEICQ